MRLLLTIALLTAITTARAQSFFSRDYWLSESGVPQKVSALAQDAKGYLYVGTDAGIYRFNGRSFVLMDSLRQPVTALARIGESVYAGFGQGTVARISGARIHPLRWQGPRPGSAVTALTAKGDVLFACTDAEGFFAIAGGYSRQVNMAAGLSDNYVYALAFPQDSVIIAATDRGLSRIEFSAGGRITIQPALAPDALPDNIVRVLHPVSGSKGSLWGGMQAAGLFLYTDAPGIDTGHLGGLSKHWPWGQINDILPAGTHHLWVATESGYLLECFYSADSGYSIHPRLFKGRKLRKLLQDRSGNIWCATSDGITLITANYLRFRRMSGDYSLQSLAAMSFDKEGNLWYSQGQQLCRMQPDGQPEKIFTAPAPITAIYPDPAGQIWIGTLGAGLLCRTARGFQDLTSINRVIDRTVLHIAGNGAAVWVSSLNGVEEIHTVKAGGAQHSSIIRHHGKASGAGSDYVYQVFPDSRGRIWFATDGAGVTMWDGRRYHTWDSSAGLDSKVIYSITEDKRGHIWAASLEKGLYEWDERRWQQLGEACGLQDVHISAIAGTGSGQLAIAHSKGLDQWYPNSRNFRHYNRKSGLDIDSQSSALNCYATDRQGNVWMPFEDGFVQLAALAPYPIKPGISIEEAAINQQSLQDGRRSFAADENYIGFRYEAISFTNPEKLFYRYRLEGYDPNWITTSDEQVTFPRLPSGAFTFRVQAALDPAFDGATETAYTFHIATPLWQRPWMILLMTLMAGSIIFLLLRLRERQRQRLAALYQARLVAEYEQLKSQINPHFLFNSLNTLVSLIEESPQSAVQYTTELSDLYRNMLAYRDRDTILLGEELMLLQKYFFILKSRFADSIHLDIRVPEELQARKRIVPLSLQMLVENAVKHNVVSPSRPLCILIEADDSKLSVRHALQPKLSKEKGAGLGLANIRSRYALLTKQSVSFGVCGADYVVTLPLL
jgi:ligand-binding sensor domain-containing protein